MGHNPQSIMDIYEIIRRWHGGASISGIARSLGLDRKTVRRYVQTARAKGITREARLPEFEDLAELLGEAAGSHYKRTKPACEQFEPYKDEIYDLITDRKAPITLLSAWDVIRHRYPHITASYSALKRAARRWWPHHQKAVWRHEVPPGHQGQIDYGKVGTLYDHSSGRTRAVYAFIGILAFSRYKFIEFVYTQRQTSFVATHVNMFRFWGGVSHLILPDCLKSGVLSPDLYDPRFNPLYRQMAEHYGCFIDPARPGEPRDKGKVERAVRPARELFRRLKAKFPQLTLAQANQQALAWCRHEDGMRPHGTTGIPPYQRFIDAEYPALLPLPEAEFELAEWKQVKVHVDQYVQFEKAYYSLPARYRGAQLWLRAGGQRVDLYDEEFRHIKTYPRSYQNGSRNHDPEDFPADTQAMMSHYSVRKLISRAEAIGPQTTAYIEEVLQPHAMRNMRKAMGILALADTYGSQALEAASRQARTDRIFTLKGYRRLLEAGRQTELPMKVSGATSQWVRSPEYFCHTNGDDDNQ